jgi:hypothetical protein
MGAGPSSGFRIVLVKTLFNVRRNSDVMFPCRNALQHVNEVLQKNLEPLTRIELVTFRYGRSTKPGSFKNLEPLTRIELVTFRYGRSTKPGSFKNLEPLTRIELVTFRYGRSTKPGSFKNLEPLTRIELVTSSLPRTRSTN